MPSTTQDQRPSPQRGISIHFLSKEASISLAGTNSLFLSGHWRQFPQQALAPISSAATGSHFLRGMLASISSEEHWYPFFQQGSPHHLGRHLRPSPQWALAAISSAGALASISSVRQPTSPEQAPEAISLAGTDRYFLSKHWQPSLQQSTGPISSAGTGCHLLSYSHLSVVPGTPQQPLWG